MLIYKTRKFIAAAFDSEQELEEVVQANAEDIFGPDSIYLPKALIRSPEGFGTIPDGFAVDLSSRQWFIIEAELAAHSVWTHIAPQVAKQIIAASQPASRRILTEVVVNRVKEDSALRERFEELGIPEIDIRQVLTDIFERKPIVGIPIDHVGADLREWAQTLKTEVKLWVVRKLVEFGSPHNIIYEIPDEYKPVLDTSPESDISTAGIRYYDVSVVDLIGAGLLTAGQKLVMSYKPRHSERKFYEATLSPEGEIIVLGKSFSAPSYAALLCIQDTGSNRNTVNGWTSWKTEEGRTLAELREELLKQTDSNKLLEG